MSWSLHPCMLISYHWAITTSGARLSSWGVYKQWNGLLDWNTGMAFIGFYTFLGGLIDSY